MNDGAGRSSWGALVVTALVMFIIALDGTMLNVAIPEIVKDLDSTTSAVQSAVSLYSLVMASLMVGAGRLADMIGSKRVYVAGLIVFGLGTGLATIAPSVGILILGWSFLEGIGAAALIPISVSIVSTNYRGSQRALAFGLLAGFQAMAAGVGPIVGGYLATEFSWRYAFGIEVVVVIAALLMMRFVSGAPPQGGKELDVGGLAYWASGLILIVVGVLLAGQYGWWEAIRSFEVLGVTVAPLGLSPTPFAVTAGVLLIVRFLHRTRHRVSAGRDPLFSLGTFNDVNYKAGVATDTFESLLIAGLMFVIPMYLQSAHEYSPLDAGVALLPFSAAILVASLGLPRLGSYVSRKLIVQVGTGIIAGGLVIYHGVAGPDLARSELVLPFVLMGLGIGALLSQVSNLTLSSVPEEESGSAAGVYNTAQELGSSLGVAVIGTAMLASFFTFFVTSAAEFGDEALSLDEAQVLAIEMQDAEKAFDQEEFDSLVVENLPDGALSEIDQIVVESWSAAQRRALEVGLLVVLMTFIASTFFKEQRRPTGESVSPEG